MKKYKNKLNHLHRVTLTDNANSKPEIVIRIARATSDMVRLDMIWRSREISFKIKCNFYNSLIISILLYG